MTAETLRLVLPFAAWMALMTALPPTPWAYAVRTLVTAAVLAVCSAPLVRAWRPSARSLAATLGWGVAVGLAVCVVWVAPERLGGVWYRDWCILGEGGTVAVDASAWYWKAFRLAGSACVISVAEELFFRRWLVRWAGFWWMVALFAIEHDRYVVGAVAGAVYGWLALRKGLASAIVAHAVTNFALGVYVLETGDWRFW